VEDAGVGRGTLSLHVARRRAAIEDGPGRSKCPLRGSPGRPQPGFTTTVAEHQLASSRGRWIHRLPGVSLWSRTPNC